MDGLNRKRLGGLCGALILALGILVGPSVADAQTTVVLVRHAEKATESMDGDPALTEAGQARAQELLRVVGEMDITAVYSTPFRRTRDTARPTAEHFGVEITETPISGTMLQDMVRTLIDDHAGEAVLVVGHSNTTPALVNMLTGSQIEQLGDDEYDDIFVVTLSGGPGTVARLRYGAETP